MILCDAHADTLFRMAEKHEGPYDLSLERLKKGGVSLQVLALFVGMDNKPQMVKAHVGRMLQAMDSLIQTGWVKTDDPQTAKAGETRFMLSVEGSEVFGTDIAGITAFRELGVRMAAVTWNHENLLATPAVINQTDGLKPLGLKMVREMQRLKIAVDVSHLNIPGFYDILNRTDAPPLASHSCCHALCGHPRNLKDDQLKELFRQGGYVGVNFYPSFLTDWDEPCTIDTVIDHIDHMHQMGGEGKVGFGSDFDGISSKPEGLNDPSDFPRLLDGLRKRGYTKESIRAIAGESFLNYYKRI
ncbi:MAG: membrane dipeptidase [Bacillota bacterium]|nr:membrane dipeptidase [Bacillota bacterium]